MLIFRVEKFRTNGHTVRKIAKVL